MDLLCVKSAIVATSALLHAGAPMAQEPQEPAAQPPAQQAPPQNPNYFNPQISIVGNFVGRLKNSEPIERRFDFSEVEFGFAADADPFMKVEAYVAVAKEGSDTVIDVEEAFGRYDHIGPNLSAKFGKIKAAIGRVQRNHAHSLNFLENPMVIRDALGDEGLHEVGASLSYLAPGNRFQELTLEGYDVGSEGPVFNNNVSKDLALLGHYRTFFDFSDALSAQLGFTGMTGPSIDSNKKATLFGADYTMKWSPGTVGKSAILESEAYWTKPGGATKTSFGAFIRGTYELQPRLFLTLGYDTSEIPGTSDKHRSMLAGVTLRPTEFQHWRLEFERRRSNFEGSRNLLTLQFQWLIGAHPAHKY